MSAGPAAPDAAASPTKPAPAGAPVRAPLFSAAAWSPLKVELFRSLYIATSIAQIGTWAREAASPWLMRLMMHDDPSTPTMVGLVLTFSNLPICLFSVFAGSLADVLDRRRLLIWTHVWMVAVSVLLGVLTLTGHVSPVGLLAITFLLGLGTAATGPALQAVLPELVPPKDMALAINLNSVALNVARAVGPATFILVIAFLPGFTGVGVSFLFAALTFVGAVWVLARWKRPHQRAAVHGEEIWGAIRSGFQYTIHSPANRAILLRVFTFIVPAVVFWSQVPVIATKQLGISSGTAYAQLFAYMGLGAIFGVLIMPGLHARYRIDPVVNVCTLLFALGLIAMAFVHHLWLAAIILVFLGINWVIIPTNFNTATQKSVPPWVKGRAISWYLTVLFGSFAIGGALWGKVSTQTNIQTSLLLGGTSMALLLLMLAYLFPLTLNEGLNLSPAFKPGQPADALSETQALLPAGLDDQTIPANRPVEVTVEYAVDPSKHNEFLALTREMARHRRRNGAAGWRLVSRAGGRYVETFRFASAGELTRQGGRMTVADLSLHERLRALHAGQGAPSIRVSPVAADGGQSDGWLTEQVVIWLERALDETINGIARVRGRSERIPPRN
jgi:MFS family permease